MLHLILGGCGTGKSTRLTETVQSAAASGRKAAVLFPEQFSFEGEKKLYKALGAAAFNKIETYSFMTLSREILLQAGSSRAGGYASEQEKLLFLWQAAERCQKQKTLEILGKRANSAEFIISTDSLITKLRKSGVTGERLLEVSAQLPERLAMKVHDLAVLLIEYDRILQEHDRSDSLIDLTEAAQIAAKNDFFTGRHFFIDEFDSFTGDQYIMLRTMLARCSEVTCAIRTDDPTACPTGIFLGGGKTASALRRIAKEQHEPIEQDYLNECPVRKPADLSAAAQQLLRRHTGIVPYEGHVRIVQASDPEEEVSFICSQICELLSRNRELCCRDIAIAVKQPETYLPRLTRAMRRYGLPYDSSEAQSLLHTDLVRHILTVMELIAAGNWDTDAILRYVKSPFSCIDQTRSSMLEHFCYTWSIDHEDWEKPFEDKEEEGPDLMKRFKGEALESLRQQLMQELGTLRRVCRESDVRTVCGCLFDHLAKKNTAYHEEFMQLGDTHKKDFRMVWNLLCDCLDTLVRVHGTEVIPIRQLYEEFLLLLSASTFSVPPQTLDSIHIVDAQTSRLNEIKVLFVPGVLEGVLPGEVKSAGMFSQQELQALEQQEILLARLLPELHSDELMIVVKLLTAPSEQIWLTYPQHDADGKPCVPSPVTDELRSLYPSDAPVFTDTAELPLTFFVRTLASGYDIYVRRMQKNTPELAALRQVLSEDPVYAAKLERLTKQPPEPEVSKAVMARLLGTPLILSPSGIELFHQCAFAYFCRYVLKLYVPERVTFSYQNIGNFAHFCLEQILRDTPMEEFLALDREGLSALVSSYAARFSKENFSDAILRSGRFRFNYRSAGLGLTELLQIMQIMFREEGFRPYGYEVRVEAKPAEGQFPALSLDGGNILCHGKIDRVDLCMDENTTLLRVTDYKTGDKSLVPEKLSHGLDMQMLLYLFALEQSQEFGEASPSGVLYLPAGQLRQIYYETRSEHPRTRKEILGDYYLSRGLLTEKAAAHMGARVREQAVPVMQHREADSLFLVKEEQMQHLQAFVEKKVLAMGRKLLEGQIAPNPFRLEKADPCAFCTFGDLCGKKEHSKPARLSTEEKKAALAAVFEGMEEEKDA
ncbi:MAG: PD-(D/E)XK nuclease family protein [Oscillospiraceae bacterium]|nr:PD-(D/E)XK nuclease family protein [Oscillospiraceae bacterium]